MMKILLARRMRQKTGGLTARQAKRSERGIRWASSHRYRRFSVPVSDGRN